MKVCFVRHGPAVPRGTPGIEDDARPLTKEGRARTLEAARGIRALKLGIDAIWTSPLPRALETAEILARALRLPPPKRTDALSAGTVPALLKFLRGVKAACPALVGHEPVLGAAVAFLTGGRSDAFPMKKAGLAVLDLDPNGAGTLSLFLTPAALRALGAR